MFNYKVAEAILDKWCLAEARPPGFRRSYAKLKMAMYAMAYVDYNEGGRLTELTKARAWEELQITATARGESCTSGLLYQLWRYCRAEEQPDFKRLFETAFELAEAQTPKGTERLYTRKQRMAPFLWLSDDTPDLEPYAPYRGPRLVDMALQEGWDVDQVLADFAELARREEEESLVKVPTLRLIDGGADADG